MGEVDFRLAYLGVSIPTTLITRDFILLQLGNFGNNAIFINGNDAGGNAL